MREIEFRCWSYNSSTMQDWGELKKHGDFYRLLDMPDKYPMMQYTGLKDSNGVKIFEGDIVYVAGYGYYMCEYPSLELFDALMENDIGEIKGNIYETPGLLKEGEA